MSPSKHLSTPKNTPHSPFMLTTIAKEALTSSPRHPEKALKTIQETITKNANIPFLHYAKAIIHFKIAGNPKSDAVGQKSRNLAFISAQKALELAPNSIEYTHFLCFVLFGLAKINGEYLKVIEECNRGLAIENPQDPGIDRLQEQGSLNKSTKERRVEEVKNSIRSLIGAVEMEINQIPVEIYVGDNRNVGIAGEGTIGKKKAKTLTRLMASDPLKEKHDAASEARSKRIEEKCAKRSNEIRRRRVPLDKVWDCWKTMSAEEKLGLLKVNIDELKVHKSELVDEELIKTVEYAKQEKKWKYWKCCLCQKRFADSKLWVRHIRSEKQWTLKPHLEMMIPELASEWVQIDKNEGCHTIPKLDFSSDFISLILDERLLLQENFPGMGGSEDHKPARVSAVDPHVNSELPGSDGFLNWLFGSCTTEEHLHELTSTRKFRGDSQAVVLEDLSAAFEGLLTSCNKKYEVIGYLRALQDVERKRNEDHSESSEEENLKFYAKDRNAPTEEENLKLYAKRYILEEAETISLNTDGTLLPHDEECREIFHQKEIKNQKDLVTYHIHQLDEEILFRKAHIWQLEREFEIISTYDDQPYMVHLLKSFIQEKLGILAHNDAIKKSDAAEKALLAEVAIDGKKNVPKACRNGRKLKGKLKNRRKNKKQNSSENLKGTVGSKGELPLCQETIEQNCSITRTNHANSGTAGSLKADEMIIQEYEEENQRLDQFLEYQRQFEEEARQKHLEKQEELSRASTKHTMENSQVVYGRDSEVISEQTENLQVVYGKASEVDVINMEEQLKLSEPVTFVCSDIWFGSFRVTGHSYNEDHKAELVAKSQSDGRPLHLDGGAVSRLSIHNAKVRQDFEDDGRKAGQMEKADDNEDLDLKAVVEEGIRKLFDMFQATCKKQQHMHQQSSLKDEESSILLTSRMLVAIGLKSDTVEFDNFLNVKSLWHARQLQHEIIVKAASQHVHIGIPCILCGIYNLFSAPSAPIATSKLLKAALSELYCYIGFFEKEQVNAASEVLKAIFDCLRQSSMMFVSHCASNTCLYHTLHQIKSYCGIKLTDEESRLASNVISNNLQEKTNCSSNGSNEFMKLEVINNDLASNRENEERRNDHPTVNTFSKLPQIVTIVLEWKMNQNAAERSESLKALSTSLDIGVLYPCSDSGNKYRLVSIVCNGGRHYQCFAYSRDHIGWVLYNGTTDMVIGQWSDVIARCLECNLLPQVLFFEAG